MALHIVISKESETEQEIVYRFESDSNIGRFSIDKTLGTIRTIKRPERDPDGILLARATHKIKTAFQEGRFPDVEEWAS